GTLCAMGQARTVARAAVAAAVAAAVMLAMAAAAIASPEVPQPRYEAPHRPLPASPATASAISGFRGSWLDRALQLQYELSGDVGLRNAPFIGTHNSYNSVAEMGTTISTSDANQEISIRDQLDLDIRALELDLHWFARPSSGELAPVVCHAFPNHLGCSTEKPLGPVLDEINAWLRARANSDQVLFVYLEDHLDNQTGYDTAASTIEQKLGDILYAPSAGGGCQPLPLDLTRDRMLRAGKRVIIVGNTSCGIGSAWPATVFDWATHRETRLREFSDFPACGPDFTRAEYDSTQIRYFEDGRPSQAGEARISPPIAAQMARCGVDLLGLDQLMPNDPRLTALVWSWARGEPKRGRCAVQKSKRGKRGTRWKAARCRRLHRPACRRKQRWLVGGQAVAAERARAACRERDAKFAVPRTGYDAQLLRKAMRRAAARRVWLGYSKRHGEWTTLDTRAP
ncbi:MAG: hypothetical protein ACRDL1_05960, partial [Solirubrobacterales bacterium]